MSIRLALTSGLLVAVLVLYARSPIRRAVEAQMWSLNQLHFFTFKKKLKARILPKVDKRFSFGKQVTFADGLRADIPGGFHSGAVTVTLLGGDEGLWPIYYSVDGSIPTQQSQRYRGPLTIEATSALRFRSIRPGYLPGPVKTHTYFIGLDTKLPVVSLVADPVNLWNKHSGIYENPKKRGKSWEREAHIEYIASKGANPLAFPAEVRIHGNFSRSRPIKSFRIRYALASVAECAGRTEKWRRQQNEPVHGNIADDRRASRRREDGCPPRGGGWQYTLSTSR